MKKQHAIIIPVPELLEIVERSIKPDCRLKSMEYYPTPAGEPSAYLFVMADEETEPSTINS